MVDAITAERKHLTRRMKGLERFNINPDAFTIHRDSRVTQNGDIFMTEFCLLSKDGHKNWVKCPYNINETLWVRETWAHGSDSLPFIYKSGYPDNIPAGFENIPDISYIKWKPSIHMPREACRIELYILSLRLERLHDITIRDCVDEGIEPTGAIIEGSFYANYGKDDIGDKLHPFTSFKTLWISIHGQESWNLNPWVWRIEFERTK